MSHFSRTPSLMMSHLLPFCIYPDVAFKSCYFDYQIISSSVPPAIFLHHLSEDLWASERIKLTDLFYLELKGLSWKTSWRPPISAMTSQIALPRTQKAVTRRVWCLPSVLKLKGSKMLSSKPCKSTELGIPSFFNANWLKDCPSERYLMYTWIGEHSIQTAWMMSFLWMAWSQSKIQLPEI